MYDHNCVFHTNSNFSSIINQRISPSIQVIYSEAVIAEPTELADRKQYRYPGRSSLSEPHLASVDQPWRVSSSRRSGVQSHKRWEHLDEALSGQRDADDRATEDDAAHAAQFSLAVFGPRWFDQSITLYNQKEPGHRDCPAVLSKGAPPSLHNWKRQAHATRTLASRPVNTDGRSAPITRHATNTYQAHQPRDLLSSSSSFAELELHTQGGAKAICAAYQNQLRPFDQRVRVARLLLSSIWLSQSSFLIRS